MRRRSALRLAGFGLAGALAGCVGGGDEGDDGTPGAGPSIAETAAIQLATRTSRPRWQDRGSDGGGHVVVIDSQGRTEAAINQYAREMSEDRTDEFGAFMEQVTYGSDRLLLVETTGPTACYDGVDIADVRVEDGRLRASATAVDSSADDDACEEVVTYASALLRVTFEGDPLDQATVEVSDGWGETTTVSASTADSLSPDPVDLPGHIRPDGDPEPVEPLTCEDESFQRHPQRFEESALVLGDVEQDGQIAFSLRVGEMEYVRGDTVEVSLTNVADREVHAGGKPAYNLQIFTTDGWREVRGGEGPFEYADEEVVLYPGDGYEWSFEFTESGVVEDSPQDLRVCPGLEPGRYRFAFWGLPDAEVGAIAVEFDLLE